MIQPSQSTVMPPMVNTGPHPGDQSPEGLEPILLSSQARERLRVLNRALESVSPSSNRTILSATSQQTVFETINE